jgi:telomere length regulation protein
LIHAESVIRGCSTTAVNEIAADFIRILLRLENRYATVDFDTLRFQTMVALTAACPVIVADILGKEFYARNYSIRQRMDILDVLSAAAAELSEPAKLQNSSTVQQKDTLVGALYNKHEVAVHEHWSEIIRKRLEAKTLRYNRNRTSVAVATPTVNRFASCAGFFFYSLMHCFDRQTDACIDLLGVDHLLYERLVYVLGKIVFFARSLPCARKMSIVLLEFVRCARHHAESGVRRAVLFAVCCALVALPPGSVNDDSIGVITDLGDWLKATALHDTDNECQKRSSDTLLLLEAVMQDALTS